VSAEASPSVDGERDEGPRGWSFWAGLAVGWSVIAFGIVDLVRHADATNPPGLARWVLGGLLVHDLLLAPVVAIALVGIQRWTRPPWRGPVTAALATTALVVLFAFPLLRGYGRRPANPSALPRDYVVATVCIIGAIWVAAAIAGLIGRRSRWR
jgi:hypothetical protein